MVAKVRKIFGVSQVQVVLKKIIDNTFIFEMSNKNIFYFKSSKNIRPVMLQKFYAKSTLKLTLIYVIDTFLLSIICQKEVILHKTKYLHSTIVILITLSDRFQLFRLMHMSVCIC